MLAFGLRKCRVLGFLALTSMFMLRGLYGQGVLIEDGTIKEIPGSPSTGKIEVTTSFLAENSYKDVSAKIRKLKEKSGKRKTLPFRIGDEESFFVRNVITGNSWNTILAVLSFQKEGINIWFEKTAYDTLVTTTKLEKVLSGFTELLYHSTPVNSVDSSKGVLEILTEYAGEFPDVDGDGVLDVVLLDIQDGFEETGSFVAGFFDPVNLYEFEFSNERDMIYLDLYPAVLFQNEVNVERAVSTFAHESQHLIHAGYEGEKTELVFVNEGFSEAIEILAGFEPRSEKGYQQFPLRGLLDWNFDNPIPDYSRTSLWTHYLLEQLGPGLLKNFVQEKETGYNGYHSVIKDNSELSFQELFRNWGLAMLLNDTAINPEYGYKHPLRQNPILSPVIDSRSLPGVQRGKTGSLVHLLASFPFMRELKLETGKPASSDVWLSSVSQYPEGGQPEMRITNQSFLQAEALTSDYGSIQMLITHFGESLQTTKTELSFYSEGERSAKVTTKKYGDGNPDTFYLNASYLTLNGSDQKLGVVFPPSKSTYWLKDILLRTVYKSELAGSGISGEVERDFELDIYSFNNGKPGEKLIPTVKLETTRDQGKLVREVFSLENYYSELSDIQDSIFVVIGNDGDDKNYIALGMDEGSQNASFFTENNAGWISLAQKSIGGNSLSNWNPVIQINAVEPEVSRIKLPAITDVEYTFREVLVKVVPGQEYDSSSVNLMAQLPDGSFSPSIFKSRQGNEFTFALPVLVDGQYKLVSSYTSPDSEITYTDEKEWEIDIPNGFELQPNFPNPFNPSTNLPFVLLEQARVEWQVFDILGRLVMEIPTKLYESGEYIQELDMSGFSSGVYIARARLNRERDTKPALRTQKIMLIK